MRTTGRGSFAPVVGLGLAAAGLAAVASGRTWATATVRSPGLREVAVAGADVAPVALPLSLVALAAWGTVLVLRRRARRAVSVLGAVASLVAAAAVMTAVGDSANVARDAAGGAADATTATTAWPVAAVIGLLASTLCFAVAVRAAASWPEMSSRYDAPGGPADSTRTTTSTEELSERDLWRALDEGHDPTA